RSKPYWSRKKGAGRWLRESVSVYLRASFSLRRKHPSKGMVRSSTRVTVPFAAAPRSRPPARNVPARLSPAAPREPSAADPVAGPGGRVGAAEQFLGGGRAEDVRPRLAGDRHALPRRQAFHVPLRPPGQ